MKDKNKKSKEIKNVSKYIDINPTLNEAETPAIVITFGRFSPVTVGHEKLVNKVINTAIKNKADSAIYTSHTFDKKKNPLPYDSKIMYLQKAFGNIVRKSKARTIIEVAKELSDKYNKLIVVVGSDRVSEFETLLKKYNGKEYDFDEIEVVSAGERDPDADDVTGMSASKMRLAAVRGDYEEFQGGLPRKLKTLGRKIYDEVRSNMDITEELDEEALDERAPLTVQQRRRRGRTMRRYKSKIAAARKRNRRKKASTEKLKQRAQKRARQIIRDRLSSGKKYGDMSPSEKVALDKRLLRIPKAAINRIAKRQLPSIRQAETRRLASLRSTKKEDLNIQFENFILENDDDLTDDPYHKGVSQSTAEKRRAHFNKKKKMDDDNPAAYEPAPGDATTETKPSKHTKRFHKMYKKEGTVNCDRRFKMYRKKTNPYFNEEFEMILENKKAIKKKAEQTGISYGILKQVFDRGVAAWRTGHRPGTTPTQWGLARINSFATGGKTQKTTDADLWKKHKEKKEEFVADAQELMEMVESYITELDISDPNNREEGSDNLVKIYKDMTPGQSDESYFDSVIPSSYGSLKRGDTVKFTAHSMDMIDSQEKEGTVVGSNLRHLRVRDSDGTLYQVRHNDATLISESIFTETEIFDLTEAVNSGMLDKIVDAIHKHVLKGKNIQDVVWEITSLTGLDIGTQELMRLYNKKYGNQKTVRDSSKLKTKYGFK